MRKQYESKIMKAIHKEAQEFFKVGAISEERMKEFDRACFVQESEIADESRGSTKAPKARKVKTPA